MENSSFLTLSGSGYLHNIVYSPYGGAVAIIAMQNSFSEVNKETIFLEAPLSGELLDSILLLESLRHQSILITFTARYRAFGAHQVEQSDNSDMITLRIDQLDVHHCYINGQYYEPLTASA